jgi:hypothetical protein
MELDYKYNDPADQITFTNVLTIIILQRTACLLFLSMESMLITIKNGYTR